MINSDKTSILGGAQKDNLESEDGDIASDLGSEERSYSNESDIKEEAVEGDEHNKKHTTGMTPDLEGEERSDSNESGIEQEPVEEDEHDKKQTTGIAPWKNNAKHKPVRKSGTRCIDDGSSDRTPAKVGKPDLSKLKITLPTERPHPRIRGAWIPNGEVTWTYRQPVDWKDKDSVGKLNNWRSCQYNRQIGPKNPPRAIWLESERDCLQDIVKIHLRRESVRGRWSRLDWSSITTDYNSSNKGTTQRAGQMPAKRGYSLKSGRPAASASLPLQEDRAAPERTEQACRNQIEQFLGGGIQKMVKNARAKDEQPDSEPDAQYSRKKKCKVNAAATQTSKCKGKGKEVENKIEDKVEKALNKAVEGAISDWDESSEDEDVEYKYQMEKALEKAVEGGISDWDESSDDADIRYELQMEKALARSRAEKKQKEREEYQVGSGESSSCSSKRKDRDDDQDFSPSGSKRARRVAL